MHPRRVAALLAVLSVACGGGGPEFHPIGPDEPGALPAASISVVSGANQTVGPGQTVPVAPVFRVLNTANAPVSGARLTLVAEGGKGALDATSVTTGGNGEATLPRWVAPLTTGEFAVSVTTSGSAGSTVSARVTATVGTASQVVTTQTLGAGGGIVQVTLSSSLLNGLQITVPPAALPGTTTFTISTRGAPLTLPAGTTLASPVIEVAGPTALSDSLMLVKLPASVAGNGILSAFLVTGSGSLVPVTAIASDANSVTIAVSSFATPAAAGGTASLRLDPNTARLDQITAWVLLRWFLPASGVYPSGDQFRIGIDNAAFYNWGSAWQPGGFCVGSTLLAGEWYRRLGAVGSLRATFGPLLPLSELGSWSAGTQLNPAIRLASELQKEYGRNNTTVGRWKVLFGQSPVRVWANVLQQMVFSGKPVYISVRTADDQTGHAVLAYKVDVGAGRIYVADPNRPSDERFIQYNAATETFSSYTSAPNAKEATREYTAFADATWMLVDRAAPIGRIIDRYLENGLRDEYVPLTLQVTLASGQVIPVTENITSLSVQNRDKQLRFLPGDLGVGDVDWMRRGSSDYQEGLLFSSGGASELKVPLVTGLNKVALVFNNQKWYDAKVLLVTRAPPALKFLTEPADAAVNQPLGPVKIGMVDENGDVVPERWDFTLTLTGGAAGGVLSGGGALRTDADGTLTLPALSVNQVGTGYKLQAAGTGLTTVSSRAFEIRSAGGGSFTGRVYRAPTPLVAVEGASIVVKKGDGSTAGSATSQANGNWSIDGLEAGTYTIVASKTGFVTTTLTGQTLVLPSTPVEQIPLVPNAAPGGISGNIRNASTTALITSLVTVELRDGVNNTTGATVRSMQTSTGTYNFADVPAGVYTVSARGVGYADGFQTGIVVGAGTTTTQQDVQLSPASGAARIVLTWGAAPSDLDSHLTGPQAGGTRFWVYFSSRGSCSSTPFACLDVDRVTGFGPETMTLTQITPGVYRYYVYDYTNRNDGGSTGLGFSTAMVKFYVGTTLKQTFFVPSGAGNAWEVFEWDGTTVTAKNRLYVITGVPMPAIVGGATAGENELVRLIRLMPAKPR